jgi:hypothetical protein
VVNKVQQWEEFAKRAQEGPQKIILRGGMPSSIKKANRSEHREEVAVMPSTRESNKREKAAAAATEAMAAAKTARPEPTMALPTPRRPPHPPRKEKVITV